MKSVFQSSIFSLRDLIILDSDATIHIFNNLSQFSNFWKALCRDYLIAESLNVSILSYEKMTLQTAKESLWFKNVIFCTDFAINLILFSFLKEKDIYWNMIHNTLFCKSDLLIVRIMKKLARQQMIKETDLQSAFKASQICWKISWAFCLSFKENNVLWHAWMKYSELMNLHKLDVNCLKVALQDSKIFKCWICSLTKIK